MPETVIAHFIGDISQPMHVSGRARGGNDAPCRFDGRSTQFHAVWDYLLIEKYVKTAFKNEADYTSYMIDSLEAGPLSINRTEWESCIPNDKSPTGIDCINAWAVETNRASCDAWAVYEQGGDLGRGPQYETLARMMELQIAKGGIRLAAFLNAVLQKECHSLENGSSWSGWKDFMFNQ